MRFGCFPVEDCAGAILAHSVRVDGLNLKKGERVTADHVDGLLQAGVATLMVAALDAGDVDENNAAERLAAHVAGPGLRVDRAFTGRANLFAATSGVLSVESSIVDRLNDLDERMMLATLPHMRAVSGGEMVASVKIIPFAVEGRVLASAIEATWPPPLRVHPYRPRRIAVISTLLPSLKSTVISKTLRILEDRLQGTGSIIATDLQVQHQIAPLAQALRALVETHDLLIVYGATAITDRRDVIPAGVEAAGGRVEQLGMPVDPGNLLMLGQLGAVPVLGAPGCARSPKENGFDWVLQRLLADIPVAAADVRRLGTGGLLLESGARGGFRHDGTPASRAALEAVLSKETSSAFGGQAVAV